MKKLLLLIIFLSTSLISNAQDFSFGLVLNTNYYDVETKGGSVFQGEPTEIPFGIGGYLDYSFNNNLGIKTSLTYNAVTEGYRLAGNGFPVKKKSISLVPHLKFDTNGEYNKGFYLLAGPRISFVLSSKDKDGNKIEDFYKGVNVGIQLGFGISFLKHFAFEIVGDYGLSDILEVETEAQTAGISFNLNINLESILN